MEKWARLLYQPALPLREGKRVTASPEHIDIARRAAAEGMVLLKNTGSALPLDKAGSAVLLGKASVEYIKGGGGSGDVFCEYTRSLCDGLKRRGIAVYEPLMDFYRKELEKQYRAGYIPGLTAEPAVPERMRTRPVSGPDLPARKPEPGPTVSAQEPPPPRALFLFSGFSGKSPAGNLRRRPL